MWQSLQNKWQSLTFRLMFYFLLALLALALVLAISFSQRIKPHVQHEILPNVERYIEYLIEDIGSPPDLVVAQRLAEELPFELRIEGPGLSWSSTPGLLDVDTQNFEAAPRRYEGVYYGYQRTAQYLLIERQEYAYLFAVDNSFRRGSERRHGILFTVLGLIFLLLFFLIRRMFKPISAMSRQVQRIGEGELEQSLDASARGELATLAAGINQMSERIKSMLDNKSALLLAISHELRSPLTRMRVNLELLEDSDIRQKLIDDVREMDNLVATILESEKLNSGHAPLNLEVCGLHELIAEVVQAQACAGRIDCNLDPVQAEVDPMRFRLLAKNLIDNACQYSDESDAAIELRLAREAGGVVFEVLDHGAGIAAEQLARLTEPFYRPDSARQRDTGGYGLGLYLCQLVASAHGGTLQIESTPGTGTRVIVRLPLDNS